MLDIVGLLVSLIGALLTGYGAITSSDVAKYKRSVDININLYWGLVLLVFGLIMLFLAWRGKSNSTPTDNSNKP